LPDCREMTLRRAFDNARMTIRWVRPRPDHATNSTTSGTPGEVPDYPDSGVDNLQARKNAENLMNLKTATFQSTVKIIGTLANADGDGDAEDRKAQQCAAQVAYEKPKGSIRDHREIKYARVHTTTRQL